MPGIPSNGGPCRDLSFKVMSILKKGLSNLNADALVAKAEYVIDQLTANVATFATPNPTLAVVTTAKQALRDAIAEAMTGSHEGYSNKRAKMKTLKDLLNLEGDYVISVAQGDETKFIQGGFEARKRPEPAGLPTVPDFADYTPSKFVGSIEFTWACKGARSYQVFISETDPTLPTVEWDLIGSSTKRRFRKNDLTPGKAYWVNVVAVGDAGESPASRPLMCRAS